MLTLVNARTWSTPEDRTVHKPHSLKFFNLFNEESMASPYRPMWHPMTRQAQCTEVTPSYSCCDQRTRGLIVRLGLNVACASQVYVEPFKTRAPCIVPSLALILTLFIFFLELSLIPS